MILNVINEYDVNFIMPISKIDENMDRAHLRKALLSQKFWFRTDILGKNFKNSILQDSDYLKSNDTSNPLSEGVFEELYIHEILEGK